MDSPGRPVKASLLSSEKEMSDWDSAVDELTAGSPKLREMVNGTQVFLRRVVDTSLRSCLLWSPGPCSRRSVAFRGPRYRHVLETERQVVRALSLLPAQC